MVFATGTPPLRHHHKMLIVIYYYSVAIRLRVYERINIYYDRLI